MKDDAISRQEAIDAHCELCGDRGKCNCDICPDVEVFQLLPSVQSDTDEEIQKMQDMEQAQLDKAFELGREDAKAEIIHCKDCRHYKQKGEPKNDRHN